MGACDDASFEAMYRRHYAAVRRFAASRFGDDEADDVAQETMLRAWTHYEQLADDGRPLAPWLRKVASDIGIDRARRARRLVVDGDAVSRGTAAVADETLRVALQVDTRPLLRRALRTLSPGDRRALTLHAVAGQGIGEIAAATGVTANAVRQRLFRARRDLRDHYRRLGGPDHRGYGSFLPPPPPTWSRAPARVAQRVTEHVVASPVRRLRVPDPVATAAATVLAAALSGGGGPVVTPDAAVPRAPAAVPAGSPAARGLDPAAVVRLPGPAAVPATGTLARAAVRVAGGVAPGATRVEAESGDLDAVACGDGVVSAVPEPGASGAAVLLPGSGCAQDFRTGAVRQVTAIRVTLGGWHYDLCGHFEVSGAITGSSETFCEAAGAWLLVPVRSTAGAGTYTVTWVVDDPAGRTWLDAIVDLHVLAPPGDGAPAAACADGVDGDRDGRADYPAEPACASALDDDERSYGACDDGLDNDGDGHADYGADGGCGHWAAASERCPFGAEDAVMVKAVAECVRRSGELPGPVPGATPPPLRAR